MSVFLILCGLFFLYFSCFDKDVRLRFPALVRSAAVCCAAGRSFAGGLQRRAEAVRCAARGSGGCAAGRSFAGGLQRRAKAVRCAARGSGGCAAERSSAGGLQRRGLFPLYAARYAALSRGPRGAAAAFLASLMRR